MSDRPLTPPCAPFGTRRFNQTCKDSYLARISKYSACASLLSLIIHTCKTSSGKSDYLHLIYLPHLRSGIRAVYLPPRNLISQRLRDLDFVLFNKLVRSEYALYVVPVCQTGDLPAGHFSALHPASFRFHLTMDTLAFG